MRTMKLSLLICSAALLACSCATRMPPPPDVGQVVVAPKVELPPLPLIVQQTLPEKPGYFQCSFLTYFGQGCDAPTTSTTPTPAAAPPR